jgi:ABC-type polysaccharide/polyol phosphate transport system ATPase subunit
MPSIELVELTKAYPLELGEAARTVRDVLFGRDTTAPRVSTKVAVDRVSLKVAAGERVGIVGRNGAGKSTLLHMIAAVGAPTSGTVRVDRAAGRPQRSREHLSGR